MQLTQERADQLYPYKSDKIWFFMHAYNEEDCIARCLNSVKDIAYKMVVLIDSRTTDKTREIAENCGAITFQFKWIHSFAWAKNMCLQKGMELGLQYGDWVLFMGADFELQNIDLEFVKDPLNFFGQFEVPEFHLEGEEYVSRRRKLLWRHHQFIYWERLVHEEAIYSAYRMTGLGIIFGTAAYKDFPIVGEMLHYGFKEDGGEEGEVFWRKKCYYLILTQIQKVMSKCNFPDTENGILNALKIIYDDDVVYDMGIEKTIMNLLDRYISGDIPQGLAELWKQNCLFEVGPEHE